MGARARWQLVHQIYLPFINTVVTGRPEGANMNNLLFSCKKTSGTSGDRGYSCTDGEKKRDEELWNMVSRK